MRSIKPIKIVWNKKVAKQLVKLPSNILVKFYAWITAVELVGIQKVRQSPGFHDEPLSGQRDGERSIRLNKAYRAIYKENSNSQIEVLEVNRHVY